MDGIFLRIDLTEFLNNWIFSLVKNYGDSLHVVSSYLLDYLLIPLELLLVWLNPLFVIALIGLIAWHGFRSIKTSIIFMVLMYIIGSLGIWEKTMQTLSIMFVSILIVTILGLPLGVLLANQAKISKIIAPILDAMQTFPMFVYMLPAVMLFSIGKVPAVIATVIYSMPPLIRLTELGINQVRKDVTEAARAFGASNWQILLSVQLPLARPSIMAGINQTTMLALAMVVVASMIGARGLGEDVLYGITNLDFGRGVKSGIGIVILAFVIDRITQIYGESARSRKSLKESNIIVEEIE